jgi:hypothetical protein
MTDEELYVHLGRLIEAMPNLNNFHGNEAECQKWLAKAHAVVDRSTDLVDKVKLKRAIENYGSHNARHTEQSTHDVTSIIFREFAKLELKVAPALQGSFVPAGSAFDAYRAIGSILNSATNEIFIIDPYMDGKIVAEFLQSAPENVHIRLLSDHQTFKPDLPVAALKWTQQYQSQRPLAVRLSPARQLHDRLIIIDAINAWTVTQSFKDFAARSPASIVRSDPETAKLKVAAYDDMWNVAQVVQ